MKPIKITVTGSNARVTEKPVVTSGTVGLPVEFTFDEDWEGLNKTAVFKAGSRSYPVSCEQSAAAVPWEVLEIPGIGFYIGVFGTDTTGAVRIPTVWALVDTVRQGITVPDATPTEATPSVYDQILSAASMAVDVADSVREDADKGLFNGEKGEKGEKGDKGDAGSVTSVNGNAPDGRGNVQVETAPDAVRYTSQNLTEEQKVQARNNIGAAYKGEVVNLLPNNGETTTKNGVTFTVQPDGRVVLSGAATKETEFFFCGDNLGGNYVPFSAKAGTYYLSGVPSDAAYAKYYLRMDIKINGIWTTKMRYGGYHDGSRSIFDNDIVDADMTSRIVVNAGVNVDGVVFEPMLTIDPNAEYVPYGMTESECAVAALQSAVEEHKNKIAVLEENIGGGVAPYFVDEVSATIDTIAEKCGGTSLVLNIVTDTHEDLTNNESVRMCNEMYANIKAVNDGVYCDALIHLGDSCGSSQPLYPDWLTVNRHLQSTRKRLAGCNDHSVMLVGNHDGLKSMTPNEKITYNAMYAYTRDYVKRPGAVPYGYMDFEDRKTRCVFLSTTTYNDYTGGGSLGFGYDQFKWFVDVACATEDGWQLLIFSHYSPYDADLEEYYNANLIAKEIVKVLNAYTNHTEYSFSNYDISVSADFTAKTSIKAVAWVCGHGHYDRITKDNTYISEFDLCCPIIQTACARLEQENEIPDDNADGTNDADVVAPARITKTVTQDLWDTLVYRQDENKIYMIRFGAGEDRVIDLNN